MFLNQKCNLRFFNCIILTIVFTVFIELLFSPQGNLFRKVHADETVWTLEDNCTLLNIVLAKTDFVKKEIVWEALMEDGTYKADPITYHEMRKKMDLEKFQIEVICIQSKDNFNNYW